MAALSGLNFQPGLDFQDIVYDQFGPFAHVSSPSVIGEFFLVASFSRSAIRLDNDSVATILQSVMGGASRDFRVVQQTSWIYYFSVSSKNIGFMIRRMDNFICKDFALFFSMWRDGGPDYIKEKRKWDLEQELEWNSVSRNKKKSYAQVAAQNSSVDNFQKSVFSILSYPKSYYQDNFAPPARISVFDRLSKNQHHSKVSRPSSSLVDSNPRSSVDSKSKHYGPNHGKRPFRPPS